MSAQTLAFWKNKSNGQIAMALLNALRSKFFQLSSEFTYTPLKQNVTRYYSGNGYQNNIRFFPGVHYGLPTFGSPVEQTAFIRQFDKVLYNLCHWYLDINTYDSLPNRWQNLSGVEINDVYYYPASFETISSSTKKILNYLNESDYSYPGRLSHKYFFKWAMQRMRIMCCLEAFGISNYANLSYSPFALYRESPNANSQKWNSNTKSYDYYKGNSCVFEVVRGNTGTYYDPIYIPTVDWEQCAITFPGHTNQSSGVDQETISATQYGVIAFIWGNNPPASPWAYGVNKLNLLNTLSLHRDNATGMISEFNDPTFQAYYPQEFIDAGFGSDGNWIRAYFGLLVIHPFETLYTLNDFPTYAECNT